MTTAEALLAMKIGCRVIPVNWKDSDVYYEIQGNCVCYVFTGINLVTLASAVDKFTEEFKDMIWRIYDNSTSSTSDEDRLQDQS